MLKRVILILVLLPLLSYPQVEDDFSDGNFSSNPTWGGDAQLFTVNDYSQLQLNDVATGKASLFTPIEVGDTMEWQFWIRQAFSPSANNHARVYPSAESLDAYRSAIEAEFDVRVKNIGKIRTVKDLYLNSK